jgi:hypothetical protein
MGGREGAGSASLEGSWGAARGLLRTKRVHGTPHVRLLSSTSRRVSRSASCRHRSASISIGGINATAGVPKNLVDPILDFSMAARNEAFVEYQRPSLSTRTHKSSLDLPTPPACGRSSPDMRPARWSSHGHIRFRRDDVDDPAWRREQVRCCCCSARRSQPLPGRRIVCPPHARLGLTARPLSRSVPRREPGAAARARTMGCPRRGAHPAKDRRLDGAQVLISSSPVLWVPTGLSALTRRASRAAEAISHQ